MSYDAVKVTQAIRDLLVAVGEDPDRPGLQDTPERLSRSWKEILAGIDEDPTVHLKTTFNIGHEEVVMVRDIEFHSVCEHHLLPFFGRAHVAYIPTEGKVTGLSKLARVIEGYSRRLQIQENLTSQIADAIVSQLNPKGVSVVLEAEHMCMSMRGVRKPGAFTVTSALRGSMRNPATRTEVMTLLMGGTGH